MPEDGPRLARMVRGRIIDELQVLPDVADLFNSEFAGQLAATIDFHRGAGAYLFRDAGHFVSPKMALELMWMKDFTLRLHRLSGDARAVPH